MAQFSGTWPQHLIIKMDWNYNLITNPFDVMWLESNISPLKHWQNKSKYDETHSQALKILLIQSI